MKKKATKPKVAPPVSYKAPSFPTLAALGVIAATALVSGCKGKEREMIPGEMAPPQEPSSENLLLEGDTVALALPECETEKPIIAPQPERKMGVAIGGAIRAVKLPDPDTPQPPQTEPKESSLPRDIPVPGGI